MTRRAQPRPRPKPHATPTARPALRFLLLFLLVLAGLYGLCATPFFTHQFFPAWLRLNATVSAAILTWLGESMRVSDCSLISSGYLLTIRRGCDAIDPLILFLAGVIAFPTAKRAKIMAIVVGVPALLALNLFRIISLYYIGVHLPLIFEFVHVEVWQTLFIFAVMFAWLLWAIGASRPAAVEGAK